MPSNGLLTQLLLGTVVALSHDPKLGKGRVISQVMSLGHALGVYRWEVWLSHHVLVFP